jgi:hypothetical protein
VFLTYLISPLFVLQEYKLHSMKFWKNLIWLKQLHLCMFEHKEATPISTSISNIRNCNAIHIRISAKFFIIYKCYFCIKYLFPSPVLCFSIFHGYELNSVDILTCVSHYMHTPLTNEDIVFLKPTMSKKSIHNT